MLCPPSRLARQVNGVDFFRQAQADQKEVTMATRIQRASKPLPALSQPVSFGPTSAAAPEPGQLDKIKEMIPGESTAVYLAGLGVIPTGRTVAVIVWALVGLVLTFIIKTQQSDPRTGDQLSVQSLDWNQVIVSLVAFIVWVYAIGKGPFAALGWHNDWIATLLVLVYTYAMPQILGFLDRILK
jgi:hypothetical protein